MAGLPVHHQGGGVMGAPATVPFAVPPIMPFVPGRGGGSAGGQLWGVGGISSNNGSALGSSFAADGPSWLTAAVAAAEGRVSNRGSGAEDVGGKRMRDVA